jgi:hypothetical protein
MQVSSGVWSYPWLDVGRGSDMTSASATNLTSIAKRELNFLISIKSGDRLI